MKICLPYETDTAKGILRLSEHFGKATGHVIMESKNGRILSRTDKSTCHDRHCAPINWIVNKGAQVVLCRHLGRGAMTRLNRAGIKVLRAPAGPVEDALIALETGVCEPVPERNLCSGQPS